MQKWEYCSVRSRGLTYYYLTGQSVQMAGEQEAFKKLGLEGWELVSSVVDSLSVIHYFKRRLS